MSGFRHQRAAQENVAKQNKVQKYRQSKTMAIQSSRQEMEMESLKRCIRLTAKERQR